VKYRLSGNPTPVVAQILREI